MLVKLGDRELPAVVVVSNTVPAYISSLTMWIFLAMAKVMRSLNSFGVVVVPSGFDGFVMNIPLTFRLSFVVANEYASSMADFVILKPFELEQ